MTYHLFTFFLVFFISHSPLSQAYENNSSANTSTTEQNSSEKSIADCGMHPYQQKKGKSPKFKKVKIGKHGFILQRAWKEKGKYYVNATHFSAAFPRHLFSTMITIALNKKEFSAVQEAFNEHPGKGQKGLFAPFFVFSRQPMIPGQASPNETFGFCMKDFVKITKGKRQSIYGGDKNVMFGNIRKWNPEIKGVFAPYTLKGKSPVIEIDLEKDIEVIFYHPHRPAQEDFQKASDSKEFWLITEEEPF